MSKKAANQKERSQFVMAGFDQDDIDLYHKLKQDNWFATNCGMRPLAGGASTYSVEELKRAKAFMASYRKKQRERQEKNKSEELTEKQKERREAAEANKKKAEENAKRKAEKKANKKAARDEL